MSKCGSEPARDEFPGNASRQAARVIARACNEQNGIQLLLHKQLFPCQQFVATHFYSYSKKLVY
jgi:hypothetical protein